MFAPYIKAGRFTQNEPEELAKACELRPCPSSLQLLSLALVLPLSRPQRITKSYIPLFSFLDLRTPTWTVVSLLLQLTFPSPPLLLLLLPSLSSFSSSDSLAALLLFLYHLTIPPSHLRRIYLH